MGFNKFVSSFDIFGEPVSLRYSGDTSFRTMLGAIFTILLKSIMLVYASTTLLDLVEY